MRAVTKDESIAFLNVLLSGKPRVHLDAVLGHGQVPELKDFASDTKPAIEKCIAFLELLKRYDESLWVLVEKNEQSRDKRTKAEKKNSIPGTTEEELDLVTEDSDAV
jgi:hypothetical protein